MSHSNSARLRATLGRKPVIRAEVHVTPAGLLAIGGLVSSILLSTAALIGVATRHAPARERR